MYKQYLAEAEKRTNPDFTLAYLVNYTDQLLATYQEELIHLRDFRDNRLNTEANCVLVKKQLSIRGVRPETVSSTLLNAKNIPEKLEELRDLASAIHKDEVRLTMNIREMGVLTKRLILFKDRL